MLSSSIFFLLFFIQLWPVWRQSGRIIYARSNFAHPIWFRSSKEDLDHIVQNQPGCDLDGVVRFWPNTQDPEASQCARIIKPGSGWMQAAHCSFSLSNSVLFFHRQPGSYCAKPAQIWFGSGWLCQVWAKWIWSGSKPVCQNHWAHIWLLLPSRTGSDVNWIWHIYWGILFMAAMLVVQICWFILLSIKTMLHVSRSKSCSSMPPCFVFLFLCRLSCSF